MSVHNFEHIYAHYPITIERLPDTFKTHDFLRMFARWYQSLYIEALYTYRDNPHPFKVVHGAMTIHLREHSDLIEPISGVMSYDIFGQANACTRWRKKSH